MTLVHSGKLSLADSNAIKIARFTGVEVAAISGEHVAGETIILSAETLAQLGAASVRRIGRHASNVFVYGFEPTKRHDALLETLARGSIAGVQELRGKDQKFTVDANARDICRQFAGLSFGRPNEHDAGFGGAGEYVRPLVRAGEQLILLSFQEDRCRWILSGCSEIADLDAAVSSRTSLLSFFSSVAPLMMFLRAALGDAVWHNDAPTACLIIDDPLLQPRYGYLDYAKLSEVIRNRRFSSSLAFIPWNFRRSDAEIARLFTSHPESLSLCIHGCDHTSGEFGSMDYEALTAKAQLALKRMARHRALTGLSFDRVMVFPQGIFSSVAPKALKACSYVAAVNSTAHAIDATESLTLRDLLDIANTRYSNFPIFTRRHPRSLEEIAFDLFLGKPALLVVHHDYFREGYEAVAEDVRRINALDGQLQWKNLGAICRGAHKKRVADNGDVQTCYVTDRMSSAEDDSADDAEPRASVYGAKVFVRRRLCEFRDNYVDRSPLLSRSVGKAWNLVFGTGGMQE